MESLEPVEGQVVKLGAEAVITAVNWSGYELILKRRVEKRYRRPEIDEAVRRSRTAHEAKVITRLRELKIPAPAILFLDLSSSSIYMQRIKGQELRSVLTTTPDEQLVNLAENLGRIVGRMHKGGVAHGDLTLANIIIDDRGRPWLVDFGLSVFTTELEDMAVDIHLLDRSLESTAPEKREQFMRGFLRGYEEEAGRGEARAMLSKISEIRSRGRYVERG
ncbi:MAG TPA: Kae1-associated serine/threonine protein kinase [Candidatus Caldiarchaeum subterraneum]|uniref:non-specific serine/threonine protein kinase n=1 Tax=Caldiarchaeum subterraneum TaxID=311458 RepID=A0A832ZX47_CALS0|nr:Kae1-associated serine/threonine protein kinase [Aigarchaeota archaeon]HIQ28936.1 Kae1-associated serine/threonine protein kinase [Candidatus Caldarchaeum subterraneum]